MRKTRRTAEEMIPLVAQYLAGSQTAEAFCAEHAISRSQLSYWRHKYGKKAAASEGAAFVELGALLFVGRHRRSIRAGGGALLRFRDLLVPGDTG